MKALDDYVEVHVRIAQFWEKHPNGRIETEIHFPDENTVRCVARLYRENTLDRGTGLPIIDVGGLPPAATGHAEERRDQGMVNKTSAVENCETSAVGRALALMGFSIHKGVASREEVQIARRKAEGLKNEPPAATGPQNGSQAPVRYADFLRGAIRMYDTNELADQAEWDRLLAAASTKDLNAKLVKGLEAKLTELGGDVAAVRERHDAAAVKAAA